MVLPLDQQWYYQQTVDLLKKINTLMGKQISEIKENGEIRATKDITEHYFIYDNVVIDNCEDSSNDGSYKIKSISSNIIAKYNHVPIECYNSSASV